MRTECFAATILAALVFAPTAQAAEKYEQYALAESVDMRCNYLTYVEHVTLRGLLREEIQLSPIASAFKKGDDKAYQGFYAKIDTQADQIGCAAESQNAVNAARADILLRLAVAAMTEKILNDPLARLSEPLLAATAYPSPQDMERMQQVEDYLGSVLGPQLQQLAAPAQNIALSRVQKDPSDAQSKASTVFDALHIDTIFGMADYDARVPAFGWIKGIPGQGGKPVYMSENLFCEVPTLSGLTCHVLIKDEKMYAFFLQSASGALPAGEVRLYTRKPGAPTTLPDKSFVYNSAEWRNYAVATEAKKTSQTFLGATLYEFPPATLAAFKASTEQDMIELAAAATPGGDDGKAQKYYLRVMVPRAGMSKALNSAAP